MGILNSKKYLNIIIDEIGKEIEKNHRSNNLGKNGCLRRLNKLKEIMEKEEKDLDNEIEFLEKDLEECIKKIENLKEKHFLMDSEIAALDETKEKHMIEGKLYQARRIQWKKYEGGLKADLIIIDGKNRGI